MPPTYSTSNQIKGTIGTCKTNFSEKLPTSCPNTQVKITEDRLNYRFPELSSLLFPTNAYIPASNKLHL